MNIAGSLPKRHFCANARWKGPAACTGIPGLLKEVLEQTVLDGLRHHLMQHEAVAEFIQQYQDHAAELDADRRRKVERINKGMARADKEIANIMTAIKAGIFTASTKQELEKLEEDRSAFGTTWTKLPSPPPSCRPTWPRSTRKRWRRW